MDTTSEFDLNQAIRDWREELASSPAIRSADVDELESHLRDSVTALQATGLTPHEAFWVARSRLGTHDTLNVEFGKVNLEQVWANRVLWMVTGSLAIGLGSSLISGLVTYTTLGIYKVTEQSVFLGPVSLILNLAALAGLFLFLWQSGRHKDGVVWQAGRWLKTKPRTAALIAFVLMALNAASSVGASALALKVMPMPTYASVLWWRWPAGVLLAFLWPVILVWLLARTARKEALQ